MFAAGEIGMGAWNENEGKHIHIIICTLYQTFSPSHPLIFYMYLTSYFGLATYTYACLSQVHCRCVWGGSSICSAPYLVFIIHVSI